MRVKARSADRRRWIAGYKAAWRVGRKARRRAKVGVVAARGAEWRRGVYYRQNHTEFFSGNNRLTPRQRRRVIHKENAAR